MGNACYYSLEKILLFCLLSKKLKVRYTVPYISLSPAQPKVARPACLPGAAIVSAGSCVFFVIKL